MSHRLPRMATALLAGLIFGLGLSLSGMLDPVRVQGFLDVFGAWDPSLAFVLGGAVIVAFLGVAVSRRLPKPAFDREFHIRGTRMIDRRLVVGSAIFGIGWGIAGLCPGPAISALALGKPEAILFVVVMVAGMVAHDRWTGQGR
ncbi:YeeE/YedE family protein [Rhizobium leguminosarum]|uniref:YeeE/YedE family protein n=1 Tax=Rhizobium leguminosarum TaxID=384 RepID=UPI001AE34250|nr:YeeE/YedE family protein [Rhizobium leguminosarum]MBP2446953.1 putative membrane protein YedE/YeeE [Rhizobium leguminosarum]